MQNVVRVVESCVYRVGRGGRRCSVSEVEIYGFTDGNLATLHTPREYCVLSFTTLRFIHNACVHASPAHGSTHEDARARFDS